MWPYCGRVHTKNGLGDESIRIICVVSASSAFAIVEIHINVAVGRD
jgi:hypothetical protein